MLWHFSLLGLGEDCGLLQSQGITTPHFHRVQFSRAPFQFVAAAQCVTSAGSAVTGLLHNALLWLPDVRALAKWAGGCSFLSICCFSAHAGMSQAWGGLTCLKWSHKPCHKTKMKVLADCECWSDWWPGRVTGNSWAWQGGWAGYRRCLDCWCKQKIQAGVFVWDAEEEGEKLHMERGAQEALSQLHSQPKQPRAF